MTWTNSGNFKSLKTRLMLLLLTLAIVGAGSTLIISYFRSKSALLAQAQDQMVSLTSVEKKRVSSFMERTKTFTGILAENRLVEGLFLAYEGAFYASGYKMGFDEVITSRQYKNLDTTYAPKYMDLLKAYELSNILLVNYKGQIIFSAVPDETGLLAGRSLANGALKDTKLAQCFNSAFKSKRGEIFYTDVEHLAPIKRTAAFFCSISYAEFDHLSEGISKGDIMGVIVTEVNLNTLHAILASREGMGQTGHSYLIGPDNILRSPFNKEENFFDQYVSYSPLNSESIHSAFTLLKPGSSLSTDPFGNEVMSAYTTFEFEGKNYAIISEKQTHEVLQPIREMLFWVVIVTAAILAITIAFGLFLLNKFLGPLSQVSSTLSEVSENLSLGSNDLSSSAGQLSKTAKDQFEGVQAAVSAVNQISATIKMNSENAMKSEVASNSTLEVASRGREVVLEMIDSIEDIDKTNSLMVNDLEASSIRMTEMVELIRLIEQKTKLINDIVFQTKLLSFNASVEAARAGENGKGFAVVAEEVGQLAAMSGDSAKQINDILEQSSSKAEEIAKNIGDNVKKFASVSKSKVARGVETARNCGNALDEIVDNVQKVVSMISEISAASKEQDHAMQGISSTMIRLTEGTEDTTRSSEVSAAAAEALSQQSETLKEVTCTLLETLNGEKEEEHHQLADLKSRRVS